MSLDKIKGALSRKLGPLPAWGWLGILAGGLLVWRHFHPAPATGQTTTDQNQASLSPYADTGGPTPSGGLGTGGTPGDGSGASGGGAGDLGTPSDQQTAAGGGVAPYYPNDQGGSGYGTNTGGVTPQDSGTPRNQGATAAAQKTATLANGSVLSYDPATQSVYETAPGKTRYRVAHNVTDFGAYVTKVKRKTSSRLAKAAKTAGTKVKRPASRPKAKAHKGQATSKRAQTSTPSAASSPRSSAVAQTRTRAQKETKRGQRGALPRTTGSPSAAPASGHPRAAESGGNRPGFPPRHRSAARRAVHGQGRHPTRRR